MPTVVEVECGDDGCAPRSRRCWATLLVLGVCAAFAAGSVTGAAFHDDPCAAKALRRVNGSDIPTCLGLGSDRVYALGAESECPNACDRYLHRQHRAYETASAGRRLAKLQPITTLSCFPNTPFSDIRAC